MTSIRFRYRLLDSGVVAALAATTLLAFATPVAAQKPSLSQRVSRLEQQMQNKGQGNVGLVNQIQDLQSQLRQQQGQIEELRHEVQQLKQSSKDQYVDLDSRLSRLESGQGTAAPASSASSATAPAAPADTKAPQAVAAAGASQPASASTKASQGQGTAAQAAYDAAFQALRGGDFVKAAHGFRAFTQTYPSSSLTDNAYYWLGESYYITQNYKVAEKSFQTLLDKFPDSAKAPGALLKLGYCQDQLKQPEAAQATLKNVISKYPHNDVAKLAQRRLQDMQLDQQPIN